MSMIPLTNFTKGELAPELHARIDTPQYAAAAKRVRNFIIQRYGGLAFRPGFRFVGEVDNVDHNIRYIPFQYNIEQAYVMALDDFGMRLLANGGFIAEEDIQITAISHAVNAQITAPYHGLSVGDRIHLSGITGMTEINGRHARVVEVISANAFTIDIDTVGFEPFTGSTGTLRSAPPTPPPAPPPPEPVPTPPPPPPEVINEGGNYDYSVEPWWSDGVNVN